MPCPSFFSSEGVFFPHAGKTLPLLQEAEISRDFFFSLGTKVATLLRGGEGLLLLSFSPFLPSAHRSCFSSFFPLLIVRTISTVRLFVKVFVINRSPGSSARIGRSISLLLSRSPQSSLSVRPSLKSPCSPRFDDVLSLAGKRKQAFLFPASPLFFSRIRKDPSFCARLEVFERCFATYFRRPILFSSERP